jgi:catechol 2,3-dioxygenase-like lactoylglutathione lyase family enzyme
LLKHFLNLNISEKTKNMIGYVTVGTNDIESAAKFYDALLAEIGARRLVEMDGFIAWGFSLELEQPALAITKPFDGNPATVGNGVMIALQVDSPEKVHLVYNKAIELGAKDEGAAGPRDEVPGFYAGYFRDLDGNKLNVFRMAAPNT